MQDPKESENLLLSAIFDLNPVGIGVSRLDDGCFIRVNPAFLAIYGYARDEIIGHSSAELGLWARPAQRDEVIGKLRNHEPVHQMEILARLLSAFLPIWESIVRRSSPSRRR